MNLITNKLSDLRIGEDYFNAFENLHRWAKQLRENPIHISEFNVTKTLAAPFSIGGLLVILMEPLQDHPWRKGVDAVVSTCPSLRGLSEGIRIGSDSSLNLVDSVSLLDQRAFICKEENKKLEAWQRERLYELVIKAIDAKKPDVVLCMGSVS